MASSFPIFFHSFCYYLLVKVKNHKLYIIFKNLYYSIVYLWFKNWLCFFLFGCPSSLLHPFWYVSSFSSQLSFFHFLSLFPFYICSNHGTPIQFYSIIQSMRSFYWNLFMLLCFILVGIYE